MQHDHVLQNWIWPFDPQSRGRGAAGKIFANMLLHARLPFKYATWPCFEKVEFLPLTSSPKSTGGSCTDLRSKVRFNIFLNYCTSVCIWYVIAAFAIPFDKQYDHVPKKWILTFWEGGGGCGQNICYHVAALEIPFNFICNMFFF